MALLLRRAQAEARRLRRVLRRAMRWQREHAAYARTLLLRQLMVRGAACRRAPEIGEGRVEQRLLLVLGDQRDLQAGVELRAPANVDERQAARHLDDAPRPDIQPQLPQQPREVHDASEQQIATSDLFVGQMRRLFLGIFVYFHVVTSRLYGTCGAWWLRWRGARPD